LVPNAKLNRNDSVLLPCFVVVKLSEFDKRQVVNACGTDWLIVVHAILRAVTRLEDFVQLPANKKGVAFRKTAYLADILIQNDKLIRIATKYYVPRIYC
jgi:hypothetical protein